MPISALGVVDANRKDMDTFGAPIGVVWTATELKLAVLDAVGASGLGLSAPRRIASTIFLRKSSA